MGIVTKQYGELVFNKEEMRQRLSPSTYERYMDTLNNGVALDEGIAEDIARAVKDWAIEKNASHFTHWFQPQRSGTAEKHDAFINYNSEGDVIERFSPSQLIQSEPDASSFPSGGIRSTFEARGYTAWDPTSPMFLRDSESGRSLIIPSIYMSWTGEALDMKTPVHRSIAALNKEVIKLQKLLGNRQAKRIKVVSGLEQEYFLIPLDVAKKRPDLLICQRTLFGTPPVKGQSMDDHYFGAIPPKASAFMNALDQELYRYGIPVKTKHNEVAPNQFELAPLHEEINLAIDHNLVTMDIMRRISKEHGFLIIHHEKPFAKLNGSGKHMNWSIGDNTGSNYLEPSRSPLKNISFLMTLGALLVGTHEYAGLLHASILDAGNEHRLGSHEAPPAILSVYLGDYLNEILTSIEDATTFTEKTLSKINHGLENLPQVTKDISDRNRTSPIAFTGNKFELRALGSSANPSDAAKILNLICAYGFKSITARLEKMDGDVKTNALKVLKDVLKETKSIRFEGNNYADEWRKEAKSRKLFMTETTPEALKYNLEKKCIRLFEEMNVLTERELKSRVEIKFENYSNTKLIEYKLAVNMARRQILPSITDQLNQSATTYNALKAAGIENKKLKEDLVKLSSLYTSIQTKKQALKTCIQTIENEEDPFKQANLAAKSGMDHLQTLRDDVDEAEQLVGKSYWTLSSYDELLL